MFAGFDEGEHTKRLQGLPMTLRLQIDFVMNCRLFLQVPFFKGCDIAEITAIVPHIYQEFAWVGKMLEREGEPGRGLFCIDRGIVQCVEHGKVSSLHTHGDFFGEASLLNDKPLASSLRDSKPSILTILAMQVSFSLFDLYLLYLLYSLTYYPRAFTDPHLADAQSPLSTPPHQPLANRY